MRLFRERIPRTPEKLQARQLKAQAAASARSARKKLVLLLPLLAGVIVVNRFRDEWFGANAEQPVQIATAILLVIVGWAFARQLGAYLAPKLLDRLEPGVAGVTGFVIRLATIVAMLLV